MADPRFAIRDTRKGQFLCEQGGVFMLADNPEDVTLYDDRIDAEWAQMNAGPETQVVQFNPVPGVTKGY